MSPRKVSPLINFLKELWRNKAPLRALMASGNYPLIRDFVPGHFYSPIPDLSEIRAHAAKIFDRSPTHLPGLSINESKQLHLLGFFAEAYGDAPFPDTRSEGFRYYFDNPYFSYGDATVLYCFLRWLNPKRIIEVGSGFSSAVMLDTNERFAKGQVQFVFIEPYPDRLNSLLSDRDRAACRLEQKNVQQVDPSIFSTLGENDILFIDSSHVAKTQSDVLHLLFHILPSLNKGVVVHFHDIIWPFEYPQSWIEGGRIWNEAYFLRAFLQYNAAFEILFFNSFLERHHAEFIKAKMPRLLKSPSTLDTVGNSSLWLRKVC